MSSSKVKIEAGKTVESEQAQQLDRQQRDAYRSLPSDHFQLAFEAAPTGKVIVDGAGNIVLVNAQMERMFGYTRDDLVGQPIETLQPGIKVLYASGYTENAIVHHGRLDVGVELISKPYSRPTLARRLRQILEAK